jgi:hypothetical protein
MKRVRSASLFALALALAAGACSGRSSYKGGGRDGELPPVDTDDQRPPAPVTRDSGARDTGGGGTPDVDTQETATLPDTGAG